MIRVVAMNVHLQNKTGEDTAEAVSSPLQYFPWCALTVDCLLEKAAKSLYLPDQPCRKHWQSERAGKKREEQNDDAVGHIVEHENRHSKDAEKRCGQSEVRKSRQHGIFESVERMGKRRGIPSVKLTVFL